MKRYIILILLFVCVNNTYGVIFPSSAVILRGYVGTPSSPTPRVEIYIPHIHMYGWAENVFQSTSDVRCSLYSYYGYGEMPDYSDWDDEDLQRLRDIDSDGDGHSDQWEEEQGTDWGDSNDFPDTPQPPPSDPDDDADGDGFPKWQEDLAGTSDSDAGSVPQDSDGDGYSDAAEDEMGTDKNNGSSYPPPNYKPGDSWYDDGTADMDGDGIPNDMDGDIDGDGISNSDEWYHGGDPVDGMNRPLDSDGDGYSDRMEDLCQTNKYSSESHPPSENYNQIRGWDGDYNSDVNGNGVDDYSEWYLGGQNLTDSDGDGYPDRIEELTGHDKYNSYDKPDLDYDSDGNEYTDDFMKLHQNNPDDDSDNDFDNDVPDMGPIDDQDDSTPEEDDTNTELTQQDIAEAMQSALQNSKGSLADAVKSGVSQSKEDIRDAVKGGIYDARGYIADAVTEGIENSKADISEAVKKGVQDAIGTKSAKVGDMDTGELEGFGNGIGSIDTGVGAIVGELTPTDQTDYNLTMHIPMSITAGGQTTTLSEDVEVNMSVLPDTTTPMGQGMETLRIFIRTLLAVLVVVKFGRSVTKLFFKLT